MNENSPCPGCSSVIQESHIGGHAACENNEYLNAEPDKRRAPSDKSSGDGAADRRQHEARAAVFPRKRRSNAPFGACDVL